MNLTFRGEERERKGGGGRRESSQVQVLFYRPPYTFSKWVKMQIEDRYWFRQILDSHITRCKRNQRKVNWVGPC